MGFSLVNGGSPQTFPGQLVYDTVDMAETGTIPDFGNTPVQDAYFNSSLLESSGLFSNLIFQGMLAAPIGTKRLFQKSTGVAGSALTFVHNSAAPPIGNRFFNANTLANYAMAVLGGIAYLYGPVRNIGNYWMTRIRP